MGFWHETIWKKICSRLFVEKFSDVFTDRDGFILMKVKDILNVEWEYSQ